MTYLPYSDGERPLLRLARSERVVGTKVNPPPGSGAAIQTRPDSIFAPSTAVAAEIVENPCDVTAYQCASVQFCYESLIGLATPIRLTCDRRMRNYLTPPELEYIQILRNIVQ